MTAVWEALAALTDAIIPCFAAKPQRSVDVRTIEDLVNSWTEPCFLSVVGALSVYGQQKQTRDLLRLFVPYIFFRKGAQTALLRVRGFRPPPSFFSHSWLYDDEKGEVAQVHAISSASFDTLLFMLLRVWHRAFILMPRFPLMYLSVRDEQAFHNFLCGPQYLDSLGRMPQIKALQQRLLMAATHGRYSVPLRTNHALWAARVFRYRLPFSRAPLCMRAIGELLRHTGGSGHEEKRRFLLTYFVCCVWPEDLSKTALQRMVRIWMKTYYSNRAGDSIRWRETVHTATRVSTGRLKLPSCNTLHFQKALCPYRGARFQEQCAAACIGQNNDSCGDIEDLARNLKFPSDATHYTARFKTSRS